MNKMCGRFVSIFKNRQLDVYSSIALGRNISYQSDVCLDKLYPASKLNIITPPTPSSSKDGKFNGFIPINQLEVSYCRSSGPGGQHVNRVNTKVEIRFKVETADWIPERVKKHFFKELSNKLTKDGYFIIKSDLTRSQHMNLADALEKLRCIVRELEVETPKPSEETMEKIRKRHEKAARERLNQKKLRSQIKAERQAINTDY